MKIRYLLKQRGPKGSSSPIYLALYSGDLTEIIYTGQRITLKAWSKKDREPKDHSSDTFKAIEKVKNEVRLVMHQLEAEQKPVTPYSVKERWEVTTATTRVKQRAADRTAKASHVSVLKLADEWLTSDKVKNDFRDSTIKIIRSSLKHFKTWLEKAGLTSLERKELSPDIISKFERYLLEKKKLSDGTHGKVMKHLRWFLKWLEIDVSGIRLRTERKEIIALSMDELSKLESVDVSFSREMQKSKDLFLLGCYTGLRISDLKRINHTNSRNGLITLKLLKNDRLVKIPITSDVVRILNKYDQRAPKINEQTLNQCIKKVCEKAGITDELSVEATRGGQKVTTTAPKYSLITSHLAGKTFISTVGPQKYKLTPPEIAAIVGKDERTLYNHYFHDQGDEARKKMIAVDQRAQMKAS